MGAMFSEVVFPQPQNITAVNCSAGGEHYVREGRASGVAAVVTRTTAARRRWACRCVVEPQWRVSTGRAWMYEALGN